MQISLDKPDLEQFVHQRVKSGHYNSPSEVVEDALRLLQQSPRSLEEAREMIDIGLEQLDRGEGQVWDADDMKRRVRQSVAKQ